MRMIPIVAAMALVASSTVAFAQADSATKPGTGLDADKNPSGLKANPAAGNPAGTKWVKHGKTAAKIKPMKTAPVSAKHNTHGKNKIDTETSK